MNGQAEGHEVADRPPRHEPPLILVLSQDIFFTTRLQDGLWEMGYTVQVVESPEGLGVEGNPADRPVGLTEPLTGADALLIRTLTELHPALMLFDLTAPSLPTIRWIQVIKTSAATRRIPIIAFAPHVREQELKAALQAGADEAVPRGVMQARLPTLVETHARKLDAASFRRACAGGLSELAREGIALHEAGEFFEAHESLEHAWMQESDEAGYLYRSLLQITVAHLHIQRGNYRGATKMLLRVRQWLDPLPSRCRGIDVATLRKQVAALRAGLRRLGPDRRDEIGPLLIPTFPRVSD
jgi:CheY-like chemotaxis protein